MSVTKAISENITSLDAAKLTGTLPAMSGAALTNLPAPTKSANDPTISTNPSGGVGTLWANTTSGEMYACTDATAGANVWTNVGGGEGDIAPYIPGSFGGQGGGQNYGYHAGGLYPQTTAVQGKYSYASDGNSTSVANLARTAAGGSGCQSSTTGYSFGYVGFTSPPSPTNAKLVQKHVFASNSSSELVGSISLWSISGATATNSTTHGYTIGGTTVVGDGHIQKISFATEAAMTEVGDAYNHNAGNGLTYGSGHASLTHGYRSGGDGGGSIGQTSSIEKWSFASDANSTFGATMGRDVDTGMAGGSSEYNGYIMGGHAPGHNEIDKFSFASDSNSTDVGDLHTGETYASGTSSTSHCYMAGGGHPQINNIQKVSQTTDGNATDVGDIIQARAYIWGYQN